MRRVEPAVRAGTTFQAGETELRPYGGAGVAFVTERREIEETYASTDERAWHAQHTGVVEILPFGGVSLERGSVELGLFNGLDWPHYRSEFTGLDGDTETVTGIVDAEGRVVRHDGEEVGNDNDATIETTTVSEGYEIREIREMTHLGHVSAKVSDSLGDGLRAAIELRSGVELMHRTGTPRTG